VRLLIDTHVLWWVFNDPSRLSRAARSAVADHGNEIVCSVVAPWELAIKHRLGRLPAAGSLLAAFPEHLERLSARELPMTSRHALLAGRLEWEHRDPFDRMLAAQSILEGAQLVTSDRVFASLSGVSILW
jgi:PIN domain nuclease of toxin-antitoxin system